MTPVQQAFGTWPSPISAQAVAAQGLRLSQVAIDGEDVYWIEGRPQEGGRNALVRRRADGRVQDVTPADFDVRSRVHEYGGGAYVVSGGIVYASNFADQRIYRVAANEPGEPPAAITPPGQWFYADAILDLRRGRLVAVREDHSEPGREPVNALVSIPLDGSTNAGQPIASGFDFYSSPRLSPDGRQLAWLAWRHPQMPWDGTELWLADVDRAGTLRQERRIAGGPAESIYQPGWTPDGQLHFVSDSDGWWKLCRSDAVPVICNAPTAAEFGRPQWVFGTASWAPAGDGQMVVAYTRLGRWHLARLDSQAGTLSVLAGDLEPREWLASTHSHAVLVAGSTTTPDAVVRVELATGLVETLKSSFTVDLPAETFSVPESVAFESSDGQVTHAFYYPPRNARCTAVEGERPPLILIGHGGPTSAATAALDLKVQFWTSRGFAVADVNYGGSSGFGRAYRRRLDGNWGVLDVDDMIAAAKFLVAAGKADANRLIIRGGSAGGYTTLAALAFHPGVFKAGASYYGICDIEELARDTHKFESRYLDTLVGPYPAARDVYYERSPIHFVDRLACALILFQGLEDKVVPPNQSATMAAAVRAKDLPVAYLAFEGEQHGFRKETTIVRSLEAELYFYGAVFGFPPAGEIMPVHIDNLHSTARTHSDAL